MPSDNRGIPETTSRKTATDDRSPTDLATLVDEIGGSFAVPVGFGPKLRRLGGESLIYGFGAVVGRLLSYLLQPYYAHEFSPAQNGIQSVVYSYIPILSIVLYLGMDVAYMRNAAAVTDSPDRERQRVFSMSMCVVAGIGGAVAAFAITSTSWLAAFTRLDASSFRYMVAIAYTDALLAVPYAHLRMTGQQMRYAVFRLLFVAISIVLNIFLISHLQWGIAAIFVANLAANLVLMALFAGDILKLLRPALLLNGPWGRSGRTHCPSCPRRLPSCWWRTATGSSSITCPIASLGWSTT
jgi:O-antigen/teichoic acid export membrane protein